MRFSESWLREWVNPPHAVQALCDQLSMAGLEVDALEPVAPACSGVAIGAVLAVEPHPDATKLRVCRVDVGEDEPLQIVCGAANVAAGQRVPVARIGAVLPGDFKIKKAKLRGVASQGMICSASELGLAERSDGIMTLPGDAPVGEDLRAWLALDDHAIELDLTPDRSDCLSVAGVAREVGVLNRLSVTAPAATPVAPTHDDGYSVQLEAPAACPRYLCRIVRDLDPSAETPLWMTERLRRSGLRPISPMVDVTNYVLLELGQPLHAFDLEKLEGPIQVRLSRSGERLALLNDEAVELDDDTLVIADSNGPVAMAGVMGGAASAVSETTCDILLESAFFAPEAIAGRARRYGLHTDSSHRFERGVDPMLQQRAIERATALLLAIAGGRPGPVVEARSEGDLPRPVSLLLRRTRIRQVLGIAPEDAQVMDILSRLGMTLEPSRNGACENRARGNSTDGKDAGEKGATENRVSDDPGAEGWQVTAPSQRFDIQREVDLIAEIGRIYGYNAIPVTHARSAAFTRAPQEMAFDLELARRTLVARGYFEAITYSFVSPEQNGWFDPSPSSAPLSLANPLSAELSVMRSSLWPGLIQVMRQNLARQQPRVRLFETGLRFLGGADNLRQAPSLAGAVVGTVLAEQWGATKCLVDFFDLKADLEAVLTQTGRLDALRLAPPASESGAHPALHPGQSAELWLGEQSIGWIGTLHPLLARRLELPNEVQLFEIDLAALGVGERPAFEPLSRFPSIRRDLAIVVPAALPFERVRQAVMASAGDLLKQLILFDQYQGDKIESDHKSLAFGLILQASSQTLTDADVDAVVQAVVERLEQELGAKLRT
ncbi:phenylalanine--tRNA ligase subunit beta [Halochromatium roseum]|uniref:phenylalanine--tRNA ligase subunit beta n=1 Tax=Halochromatium roseum TaxID=391920 RepID=UPI001911A586|nr:phenylalanine--tRNA ligase subunit beta [Halochromatium roseum]MBK5941687.1 phenylalanine--tRNA ligase subunit beta [Halochromatium roseum]